MKQSRFMSLVESITNVAVGYGLALATQVAVFPLFGIAASLSEHLAIGAAFTGMSLLRSFMLRRLFEAWRIRRERAVLIGHPYNKTSDIGGL
jgi:hypothetical protein